MRVEQDKNGAGELERKPAAEETVEKMVQAFNNASPEQKPALAAWFKRYLDVSPEGLRDIETQEIVRSFLERVTREVT